jgi:hypothetical protein
MSSGSLITAYLVTALIAGIAGAIIAQAKNRHAGFWTMAPFLFPPMLLALLLLPRSKRVRFKVNRSEDSDNLDNF